MFRLLIYLGWAFILWRLVRVVLSMRRNRPRDDEEEPPFANIEEAQFEDLTEEPPESPEPPKEQ